MAGNERARKEALNEALLRDVNERIEQLAADAASPDFLCECGDRTCTEVLPLSIAEYESVRKSPVHFALRPGHDDPAIERVVDQKNGYIVVEKIAEGAEVATELDPRSRG